MLALSCCLIALLSALPAAAQTNVERHHAKYGTTIPDPTVAPYGNPGELYGCLTCHGTEFVVERDCSVCHGDDVAHTDVQNGVGHMTGKEDPYNNCTSCHAADLQGSAGPSCFTCHGSTWSKHDFSGSPWLGPNNECDVCHLPPAFDPGNATSDPVWNHAPAPSSGYNVTTSTLAGEILNGPGGAIGQPSGLSLKCLGCHAGDPDGPGGADPVGPAVNDFPGTLSVDPSEFIAGKAALGADLDSHHPVSLTFDAGLATLHGGMNDPATATSNLSLYGTIADDMLDDAGQVQCTSCHDQHDKSKQTYLVLRGEALCFTCHDITANTPGMHHIPDRHNPWDNFRCTMCHGTLLDGTPAEGGDGVAPACTTCHNPFAVPDTPPGGHHGGNRFLPYFYCGACHADPVTSVLTGNEFGTDWAPSCFQCHGDLWNVGNNLPATPTMADLTGFVGQSVVFDGSHIVDPEGDPLAYVWAFGDGTQVAFPSHSPETTHAYEHYGTYTATLAISDAVNPPVYVEFTVTISSQPEEPVADRWVVTTTAAPAEVFTITIESHSGALVVVKDDGDVNTPDSLAYGVEFEDVIFWMDIWMDLSGNVYWGTGDVYFGNIDRNAGTMVGVVFDDQGGVVTFAATRESAL